MARKPALPLPTIAPSLPVRETEMNIVQSLVGYKREAEQNRRAGLNPRDPKWQENTDLYWNRHDMGNKADWQSQNVMPEVPSFVDRFAAAMKDAMVATPNGFYGVFDPYDTEGDIASAIKQMNDVWLSTSGRNQTGTPLDFMAVFEEQVKLGSIMAMSSVVIWKDDVPGGRVAIETVDPRQVWLDHTYRNLYRIRRTEVDRIDVARMLGQKSKKGKPIFNMEELEALAGSLTEDNARRRELTGNDESVTSDREPIYFDEYIASVVGPDGKIIADDQVMVVANDQYLVRGPEPKPYSHGKDWLVYAPLVTVPLSPYGRSYMEDFGSVAKVFTDLTNLILDAAYMSSMRAYVMVPDMLKDPTQANTGVWPNKTFFLEEGYQAEDFAKALELGTLDQGAMNLWTALKSELSEAAGMNEIGLGQLPDKTHIAASAVQGAQASTSTILRSVAQTIEVRYIDPTLDLCWKTGLQHAKADDVRMAAAIGDEMYQALMARRTELIKRPVTFQARGISGLIQRQQKLQGLLQIMQIIAQNENLVAAFMQVADMNKLLNLLFELSSIDLRKLAITERERLMQSVAAPMQEAGQQGQPTGGAMASMSDLANTMGVA